MRILLSVCGSISSYKSFDILRGLISQGHQVRVILTAGAGKFLVPQVFRYLGAEEIYTSMDDFSYPKESNDPGRVLHIELAKWCDRVVIAPLTANTLSKLCNAEADDLLTSTFLAVTKDKPILCYPAMNSNMYHHPFVENNFKKLQTLSNVFVFPTDKGELVCGAVGDGKLLETEKIIETIPTLNPFANKNRKKILISTGATLSPLDPVRYLTNSSSGITGYYLAKEALKKGHEVVVIAGKNSTPKLDFLKNIPGYTIEKIVTTSQMDERIQHYFPESNLYISSAAIGDIEFDLKDKKVKKSDLGDKLAITTSKDILKDILKKKKKHQYIVGFAAETNIDEQILSKKWKQKPVDLLIGTKVHNGLIGNQPQQGFREERAEYYFINEGKLGFVGNLKKNELAKKILNEGLK